MLGHTKAASTQLPPVPALHPAKQAHGQPPPNGLQPAPANAASGTPAQRRFQLSAWFHTSPQLSLNNSLWQFANAVVGRHQYGYVLE